MRSRNIKPGFFINEELAELDMSTRLLFVGLWAVADYKGCLRYRPKRLKREIMPYDDVDIGAAIDSLAGAGFVRKYTVDGQEYVKVVNFTIHQNPHKKEREAGSDIPDAPEPQVIENKQDDPDPVLTRSEPALAGLIPDSGFLIPDSREGAETGPAPAPGPDPEKPDPAPVKTRSMHPGIKVLQTLTKHRPPPAIWDDLIDRLGQEPDVERLTQSVKTWLARGNKPTNYEGIVDWYEHGIPPPHGRAGPRFDPGKPRNGAVAAYEPKCPECADLGTITQPVPEERRKYSFEIEDVPCPNCKDGEAVTA